MEYRIVKPDELYHYGVKGKKWGVRHDTEAKTRYKAEKKAIKAEHRKVYGDWNRTTRDMREIMKVSRIANKKAYKEGKIDKQEYKRYKKANRRMEYQSAQALEYQMAIAQYKLKKAERANKAIYLRDVYGSESKKYKKGIKAYNKNTEGWANYTITKTPNGYHVTRTDVYVY